MMLLACAGAAETMPSHGPHGKSFNLLGVKSLFLQERNNLLRCRTIYIFFRGRRGADSSEEPGENNANRLLFQKVYIYSIYICISFHKLGVAGHSIRKKCYFYILFKILNHYIAQSAAQWAHTMRVLFTLAWPPKNYILFFCFVLTKIDSLVLA